MAVRQSASVSETKPLKYIMPPKGNGVYFPFRDLLSISSRMSPRDTGEIVGSYSINGLQLS